jgi:hypothetical protein
MKKNKLLFFTAYPVRYKPILLLLVMFLQVLVLQAQGIKVSGVVKDPAGAALQGASVTVKGGPQVVPPPMPKAVTRSLSLILNPYWFFLPSVL